MTPNWLYWLWKRGLREYMLDKQRARIGREALNANAYLSIEDGWRYPRCDIPPHLLKDKTDG